MSTLNLKGFDEEAHERIRVGARLRGISQGEYVRRLVELHRLMVISVFKHDSDKFAVDSLLNDVKLLPVREGE